MDIAIILQMKGSPDIALAIQQQALESKQLYRLPARRRPSIRLLALKCPGVVGDNTPLEFLVEDSDIDLTMLYVSPDLPFPESLPDHDVLFIAVAHSEQRRAMLKWIEGVVAVWPRPVLNRPDRIALLSRDAMSARLQPVPGAVMPVSVRIARADLERMTGAEYPIIIRPVDSHAGAGLIKADAAPDISDYLAVTPAAEFYVAPFVDYRSKDGLFRKYRVVFIDGRPYAGHMAISDHWIVHYLSGGMGASAQKRSEEERFIAGFDEDFASRHRNALRDIAERVGLDYLVMDCAETPDGKLLIFEVDSSAVVHAMDPPAMFPYKKPQLRKVVDGLRAMLLNATAPR